MERCNTAGERALRFTDVHDCNSNTNGPSKRYDCDTEGTDFTDLAVARDDIAPATEVHFLLVTTLECMIAVSGIQRPLPCLVKRDACSRHQIAIDV